MLRNISFYWDSYPHCLHIPFSGRNFKNCICLGKTPVSPARITEIIKAWFSLSVRYRNACTHSGEDAA